MMNRKFVIIAAIGALILAVIGGLLVWAMKVKNQTKPPIAAAPQIKKIGNDRVVSPIPAINNGGIWYFNAEGRLFRINLDGEGLTEYPLPLLSGTIRKILWPQAGEDFIAISSGSTGEIKDYYNSQKKVYTTLPANIKSLDWMPDSRRIVYIWQSADNQHQQLAMANGDGTGFVIIKDVFWPDLQIKVSPDGKTALLYRSIVDGNVNKIYSVNLETGEILTVIDSGKNLEAIWISANRFLFSQSAITAYPRVYLFDMISKQATDLDLNTSLDKIVVDKEGKTVYAAIPKKDGGGDDFLTEDLLTFRQNDFFSSDQQIFAKNLMLIGSSLFFINTGDGNLHVVSK